MKNETQKLLFRALENILDNQVKLAKAIFDEN